MRKKYKDEWFFNFPKSRDKGGNRRAEGEEREEKRDERIGVKQKKKSGGLKRKNNERMLKGNQGRH